MKNFHWKNNKCLKNMRKKKKYFGVEGMWREKSDVEWKGDQKWNRWVNRWYKKWGDTERNEGWKRMNALWYFGEQGVERYKEGSIIVYVNSLIFYHLLFSFLPFPAPILCAASCFSLQVLPRLSICHVFSRGSGRTLTVQDCRQAGVCARRSTWTYLSSWLCPESLP